jgi:NAD(P)-dependent dehydrogenase (short-subunit alcohol dehydrogenase family)
MKDSTVVILGGSSGIGLAAAQAAVKEGAHVVIAGRDRGRLTAALEQLPNAEAVSADMTDRSSLDALFTHVGDFDHLLITAAQLVSGTLLDADPDDLRLNFDSRFWGSVAATRAALPFLREAGSVTFTSGVASHRPFPGEAVAAASAAAVESLARALSLELAPIRFNTLCPGVIDTPLLRNVLGDGAQAFYDGFGAQVPLGRIGHPQDLGHAAVFLMTNSYTTGSVLHVDGGYRYA